ncbi:MAG: caspase family protein [Desulfobacterota bacterium]|nr:caspase family protein [Thermodesulfobacteriota bacterium]
MIRKPLRFSILPLLAITLSVVFPREASAQTANPILTLETGMHTGRMMRLALDPAGRFLATAAEDKTVRLWDMTGESAPTLTRTLRPPADPGAEGKLYSVAISPDGTTVACSGWTGQEWEGKTSIYLFDRATGAMKKRLTGLPGRASHLAYSPDGRFMAAVMTSGGMRLYAVPEYTALGGDREYGEIASFAQFDPKGQRLATVCQRDGFIRMYDLKEFETPSSTPRPMKPQAKVRVQGADHPGSLAFSPDGSRLAVGFFDRIRVEVLEARGTTLQPAFSADCTGITQELDKVAWSSDGRFLYAAGGYNAKWTWIIRKWAEAGKGPYTDIPAAHSRISHLLSLSTGGVAFCTYDPPIFGSLDSKDQRRFLVEPFAADFRGNPEGLLLSADGFTVQFPYEPINKTAGLFSVAERDLTDLSRSVFGSLKATFTVKKPVTDSLEITEWRNSSSPKLAGKPLPFPKAEKCWSLAIAPDKSGFALGTDWAVRYFNASGQEVWNRPAAGIVWAMNTNGKVVVAALGNGTLCWYRVSDGKEILALFPHKDRKRWVLWTPSGNYDASPGGEDLIGWHVNNGREKEASFFAASRFRSAFYRPDVIDRVAATLDEGEAVRIANAESGRKDVTVASVRDKLPPVVAILSPQDGTEVSGSPVIIRYNATSQEPVSSVRALVDGRPVPVEGAAKTVEASGALTVAIPAKDCDVSVIAENRYAVSDPATVRLRWKGAAPKEEFEIKPKLYVLSVGISKYQDPDLRLGLAAKDALDFGSAWKTYAGPMYRGVEIKVLTDAEATKGNILDGLEWLQRQTTSKDVAILFFAGHGINDPSGIFYFLPADADLERLKRTGLAQTDIVSTVATIAGKVLVFMDACHSGNLMGKVKRRAAVETTAVINELASAENGAVVFSSASGRQYALENTEWGNGAFTKGLVEGLTGKADYRGTGRITVNMLDLYISERVKELTKGEQTPTTVKPPNVPDFPVAMKSP